MTVEVRPAPPAEQVKDAKPPEKPRPSLIPEKYASPTTSGLTVEVPKGQLTFDIQLQ